MKYRLLKDLPRLKAGAIIEFDEEENTWLSWEKEGTSFYELLYSDTFMDNKPDWFEKVEDNEEIKTQIIKIITDYYMSKYPSQKAIKYISSVIDLLNK
jgi:hypothetical protein